MTAEWATNVGNEHGQVLISVIRAAEGYGLKEMTTGKRYSVTGQNNFLSLAKIGSEWFPNMNKPLE